MSEISRVSLFGKLNSLGYKSIESATVFCKMRGNPYVELVHWINQILQLQDSDIHRIIRHFDLNPSKLAADITAALDRLPRGWTSVTDLSSHLDLVMEQAWVYATLMYKQWQVRSGHLILASLKTTQLKGILLSMSREFDKIKPEVLAEQLPSIISGSPEDALTAKDGSQLGPGDAAPGKTSGAVAPAAMGKKQALAQFAIDLTEQAKQGKLDPI